MPGNAKTDQFLLSTATVMIGQVSDLHNLNPDAHSIGLVKNVSLTTEPNFVELTQGINSQVVASTKTVENVSLTMEVYEYTLRNLAYGAGLDGSNAAYAPITTTWTTNALITGNGSMNTIIFNSSVASGLVVGDYVFLQDVDDKVHIIKVASVTFSTPNTTITSAVGYHIPTGVAFPAGSKIGKVKRLDVGAPVPQAELSAKIIGVTPKDNSPIALLIPKMKITGGISLAFQTDNYGSLPFKITPYAGVSTDPFYSEYGPVPFAIFTR